MDRRERRKINAANLSRQNDRFWTDERIGTLSRLWRLGRFAADIAADVGDGCTKNMVIGKAKRLRLEKREGPRWRTGRRFIPPQAETIPVSCETSAVAAP